MTGSGKGRERKKVGTRGKPRDALLKVSELSRATGVSTSAINYYVRMGLLPPPLKTHRNMAYYQPEYIQMINYIKRLQAQKHMPLSRIKEIMQRKIKIWGEMGGGRNLGAEEVFTSHSGGEEDKDVRRRIMEAGTKLFSSRGYLATKEEDIIERAGVSPGDFYQSYSGKEEVLLDIAEEGVRIFRRKVAEKIAGERNMLERIKTAIPVAFELIVENREIYALYLEESVFADVTYEFRLKRFTSSIVEDLRATIARGVREGTIRKVKPEIAANAIMGQLVRLANMWVEDPSAYRLEEIVREAVEFVARALSP
jgi:AcrR family transcriptional regulator/predicted DNA-binding transcriptional regulator AlpA